MALAFAAPIAPAARAQTPAQDSAYVREHYVKREVRIPTRDGVKLFTVIYSPKDTSQPYPLLLNRTPYSVGPYGADAYKTSLGPSPSAMRDGFIFVYQDVRGRFMSEGTFVDMTPAKDVHSGPGDVDESTDTYDTIDWLVKNVSHNNGRVGTWGISYPGFYTAAGMLDAHPAHRAASPQAPIADWFTGDDFHHNGALWLPHFFNFISSFGRPRPVPTTQSPPRFAHGTPDGYDFFLNRLGPLANANPRFLHDSVAFWNDVMKHPNYDAFWKSRNLRPHLKGVKPAVMTVGGWFDAENLYGALQVYRSVEAQSPGTRNTLVMGPWFHGGWARSDGDSLGNVHFGAKTSLFYRDSIELPFFDYYLKDRGSDPRPEALVFETGSNVWRRYDVWPPKNVERKSWMLVPGGELAVAALGARDAGGPPHREGSSAATPARTEGSRPASQQYDEYVSDPMHPVPFVPYTAIGMTREYMTDDQRFAATRPDVLVYETEPLAEDVTIAGPITADLRVSTSGTDADWVVKVIDVYPDDAPDNSPAAAATSGAVRMGGYQQLVRGDVMRGRFRDGYEKPTPFVPDAPTAVKLTLNDVNHTFLKGHRVMVQVQSSWFPLVDRNPQTFVPSIYEAKASDFRKATQRVYRGSRIDVNVVKEARAAGR
ncbi:MAG: CocE/NonD family hydrolase [Gemmatimonadaceae bacterium]